MDMQTWPLWAFFAMVVFAYLSGHLLGFRPAGTERPKNWLLLRIVSTTMLLTSALLVAPQTLWFTLPLAVAAGWLNGRSSPPPIRQAPAKPKAPEEPQASGDPPAPDEPPQGS